MGWFEEAKAWKESDPSVTYRQIAQKFGVARQTVKNRFCAERKKGRVAEFPTAEELIRREKEKLQRRHEQQVLKRLLKDRSRTELICDTVRAAVASLPRIPLPEFRRVETDFDDEHVGLIISDCQVGQVVDPEETGGLGEYNIEVFKRRAKHLTKSVRKITSIHKRAYNLPVLHVFMLRHSGKRDHLRSEGLHRRGRCEPAVHCRR